MAAKRIEELPFFLDTFGNAATESNANSSRHCRYIDLCFTSSGKLCGAIVSIYLLEKWRITSELSKYELSSFNFMFENRKNVQKVIENKESKQLF